ncbi:Septum formation protein Maf [Pseudohaliea rubra DSM 19751]|uniref:dTTP/UTP pyrophosphatase n=1 Tax=Pseudohaliea rubra DSM 19751 TaxID=1265313 RepID=A0A095VPB8_9GAMM|nr:Septum formation protein Maf [Pseudohaliea rubra DSM 19751]
MLASQSPRRRELLALLGLPFRVQPAAVDETPLPGEAPAAYVARTAAAKARAIDGPAVLAADTAVVLEDTILGKPRDRDDGQAMLRRLSGREHSVLTAVVLCRGGQTWAVTVRTAVTFDRLDDARIHAYLATEEPWDKAGGYGIQGRAGAFVRSLTGSYSNVVGLPLVETRELLLTAGLLAGPDAGTAS